MLPPDAFTYDKQDVLGMGSYGTVFKGELNGTTVAVKKVKVKRAETAKKVVAQEIVIHKSITHPNIVTFMGASMEKNFLYIITEYIDGTNMEDVIFDCEVKEQFPKLIPIVKRKISIQGLQALAYLHNQAKTIIHCDVKPANVLVTRQYDVAKLCDLGISKVRSSEKTLTTSYKDVIHGKKKSTPVCYCLQKIKVITRVTLLSSLLKLHIKYINMYNYILLITICV